MNPPWLIVCLLLALCIGCNTNEAPTGVSRTDVEGTWNGTLKGANLLGRSLSGEVDWRFDRKTFTMLFFDPPAGQAEQIAGNWKFANGKMVLTLRSSFPIADDVGTTDSLFVSILNNQMSIQTASGSNILLQKVRNLTQRLASRLLFATLPASRFLQSNPPLFRA